ncbi:glutamate racemase [Deferribacter autotrophicus]|uniref:Glutamate racemase n=1 Tax=Deferribacter autotrophicus TaxID=500465 RepID=A0A5A8F8G6_9BACT|nr:glutamate racemase [Deferribacter autotrophicus]KAA0258493.1 glutamate racemase [Deferribacter autotrophicus]
MAIGVFDSGVGGLTVFKSIANCFPTLDIFYLGDTARVPYGIRSKDTIIKYSIECAQYLCNHYNIEALIIACNSASSCAIEALKEKFKIPVIGVIKPGIRAALKTTKNKKILIIGTQATVNSNAYLHGIKEIDPSIQIFQKACPLFVPIVEEGLYNHPVATLMIKEYLEDFISKNIDTIILGCTHYPLLKNQIKEIFTNINIVDSSIAIIEDIEKLKINFNNSGKRLIHITDYSQSFENLKNTLVGQIPYKIISISE